MRAVPICAASAPRRSASRIHGCSRCISSGMNRREVHRVADDAVAQEIAHRRRRFDADQFLRLFGRRGDVRRGDDLRQLGQRPIGRRLVFEDVEPRAADDARFDRAPQRGLVDQLAARRVDQSDARFAAREPRVVEQMLRFGR